MAADMPKWFETNLQCPFRLRLDGQTAIDPEETFSNSRINVRYSARADVVDHRRPRQEYGGLLTLALLEQRTSAA
jgi:hypothetical protein